MTMSLRRIPDRRALDEAAADWIAGRLSRLAAQAPAVFAACGGRSVAGILRSLASRQAVPWHRVHCFMVDERMVAPDHEQSNFRLLRESLLDGLVEDGRLPRANIHPFVLDEAAPELGVARTANELEALGGRFHLALLSAGEDGHVAALFPNHGSVRSRAPLFLTMEDSPKPPPRRMSASRGLLLHSAAALLLFIGEGKRAALARFLDQGVDLESCPAKLVLALPESLVLTDLRAP